MNDQHVIKINDIECGRKEKIEVVETTFNDPEFFKLFIYGKKPVVQASSAAPEA